MKIGRLEWKSHVIRLEDFRSLQKILNVKLGENRKIGGTELTLFDDLQTDKKKYELRERYTNSLRLTRKGDNQNAG
jgi:hypothetical protein